MPKRMPTNPDTTPDWSLSQQQQTAVDLVIAGKNLQETADAIGVQRSTVSQWLNHNPAFIATLNRRRQELWDGMLDTLRGLLPQALAVLQQELDGETPLKAAVEILKSCGIYGAVGPPTGPTTPEDVNLALRQRASDRLMAELSVLASEPC
jgi:hypothetical protein